MIYLIEQHLIPTIPWNTTNPKEIAQSQEDAIMYKDSEGVCFACSQGRINKAYQDLFGISPLDLTVSVRNIDYRISATTTTNGTYAGYGVGGALANKGYGELVGNSGVWRGDLQEGTALQYWNGYTTLQAAKRDNFHKGGHSIIFKRYEYNTNGDIIGLYYIDYLGRESNIGINDDVIIFGANLKNLQND